MNRCVARRWPAAVNALAMAISTPVIRAPVIRWSAIGWPPSSQTQIVSVTPIARALASAAASSTSASSRVSRLTVITAVPRGSGRPPAGPGSSARSLPARETHLTGAHVVHPAVPRARQTRPLSSPSLRGPPRCVHTSPHAYTGSPTRASTIRVPSSSTSRDRPASTAARAAGRSRSRVGSPSASRPARSRSPSLGSPSAAARSHLFLEDVGAVQTGHVLPAHLGRLAHRVERPRACFSGVVL